MINLSRSYWLGMGLLLLTVVFWAWSKMCDPNFLPVQEVKITGRYDHVQREQLKRIISPFLKNNFLFLDLSTLRENLQRIPWVREVSLSRHWPNTLVVRMMEHEPLARWNGASLLTTTGDIFTPDQNTLPEALPELKGPQGKSQEVFDAYRQMNAMLEPHGLKIAQIDLSDQEKWQVTLSNGIQVVLGHSNVLERFTRFVRVYPQVIKTNDVAVDTVDLRYASGLAVRWKHG